jgi:hypothetical protein
MTVIRRANLRRELDRNTWASHAVIVLRYETTGSGSFLTPEIDFGVRFSGSPYVSFGAETSEVDSLVEGDYPHVTVGVAEWIVKSSGEDAIARGVVLEHIGAKLWISVSSVTSYKITHHLIFEGVAMKTPLVER